MTPSRRPVRKSGHRASPAWPIPAAARCRRSTSTRRSSSRPLAKARGVTGVLADRDKQLTTLISDGNLLLAELTARREAIHALLDNTSLLTAQIEGLVADNQATLKPSLDELHGVLKLLQDNQDSLDRGLQMLAPFYRVFANTLGTGRWFDTYIQNLSLPGILGVAGVGNS